MNGWRVLAVFGMLSGSLAGTAHQAAGTRTVEPAWSVDTGPPLPGPVANNAVAAATVDGRALVFTFLGIGAGRDHRAVSRSAFVLDIASGRWERLPDVPGEVGRLAATAQAIGGRVFVIGGYAVAADGKETTSAAVDILDVRERRYTSGAPTPVPVDDTVSGVWRDTLIFLVSGWSSDHNVAVVQIYDPEANRWRQATPIPGTPVFGHAGGIAGDTIVYCGGARVQAPKTPKYAPAEECWRGDIDPADPSRIAWRAIAHHPGAPRYRAAAGPVRIGEVAGVMFVGGTTNPYNYNGIGYDGRPSEPEAASWIYDVTRDRWVAGPNLPVPTMDHRGLMHVDGAWWTVGGFTAGQVVTSGVACLAPGSALAAGQPGSEASSQPGPALAPIGALWTDVTAATLGRTGFWTNKVEIADIDNDGRPDLLFANGGDYSTPGAPEPNQVFVNTGPGFRFAEATTRVLGTTPDLARVIKARDLNDDGLTDIVIGTTYQTQSRLFLGRGQGRFEEVTRTHLPQQPLSVGDLEVGDVDGDGDLDLLLADWGPGNNMTNEGGRTRLWLNDGTGRFSDATNARMPDIKVRFSWDLELADVDNDADLDVLVSCKRCGGSHLFRNDGAGTFADDPRALPQYTNNYEFEPMDLDGDGFVDLVTLNDGEIVGGNGSSRREHVFRNDGKGRFRDATEAWWPPSANVGEDDNMVAFVDYDSDGDADFVVGSLSGPDRLLTNDGRGHLTARLDVFDGDDTPGTLGIALADLDGDGRVDVVQGQGEHKTAIDERVFSGRGLPPDTAPPSVTMVGDGLAGGRRAVHARVHDRKSPSLPFEWKRVAVEWTTPAGTREAPMRWYGEYLWRAAWPSDIAADAPYRVCATDAAGNSSCAR